MSLSSKGSCGSNSSSLSSTAGELAVLQNEEDFKDRLEGAIRNKNFKKTGKPFPRLRDTHPGVDEFPRYINDPFNRKVINKCLKENENNFQGLQREFAIQDMRREQTRRNIEAANTRKRKTGTGRHCKNGGKKRRKSMKKRRSRKQM
jgi:hypothetical protein